MVESKNGFMIKKNNAVSMVAHDLVPLRTIYLQKSKKIILKKLSIVGLKNFP